MKVTEELLKAANLAESAYAQEWHNEMKAISQSAGPFLRRNKDWDFNRGFLAGAAHAEAGWAEKLREKDAEIAIARERLGPAGYKILSEVRTLRAENERLNTVINNYQYEQENDRAEIARLRAESLSWKMTTKVYATEDRERDAERDTLCAQVKVLQTEIDELKGKL